MQSSHSMSTPCGTQRCVRVSETESDITTFVKEFKRRIENQVELDNERDSFILFDEIRNIPREEESWLHDNNYRFFRDTPNERLVADHYLSELGYICCMTYSPDGDYVITGYSTGLIQVYVSFLTMCFYR